ncbi:MAG: hypothetical protein U5P41_07415 [Gammaproteobacteria bacterium]|nr:hypothetical protein [Gammaproteobacteria bacterium]
MFVFFTDAARWPRPASCSSLPVIGADDYAPGFYGLHVLAGCAVVVVNLASPVARWCFERNVLVHALWRLVAERPARRGGAVARLAPVPAQRA